MLKKCTWILIFLAVSLTAVASQAGPIYDNGDFEDDAALVPNAGDMAHVIPTGWQYDDYYEYGVPPVLMNVSAIGDGSGGTVGVKFPNWNTEDGWNSVITRFEQPVVSGQYTYTVTLTGENIIGPRNWIAPELWWTSNLADPWAEGNYGSLVSGWVKLSESDNGVWRTIAMDFDIQAGDPAVGTYFSPWIQTKNYNGNIILGEASLVHNVHTPEPSTMLLLGSGLVGLVGFRRKFRKR